MFPRKRRIFLTIAGVLRTKPLQTLVVSGPTFFIFVSDLFILVLRHGYIVVFASGLRMNMLIGDFFQFTWRKSELVRS